MNIKLKAFLILPFLVSCCVHNEEPIREINVCFSPDGQCEDLALFAIMQAEKEILVQCYSFTSKAIADELIEASRRGVFVSVLYDKSQLKSHHSQIHRLPVEGIETKLDYVTGIAHNKIIIIDGKSMITGSYNFSDAANLRNAENMLFIRDKDITTIYREQWFDRHRRF